MLLEIICGNKRFEISLSRIFERKGKRLKGLNKVGESRGLSGLGKRIILEKIKS
jgi:hypothetical protein